MEYKYLDNHTIVINDQENIDNIKNDCDTVENDYEHIISILVNEVFKLEKDMFHINCDYPAILLINDKGKYYAYSETFDYGIHNKKNCERLNNLLTGKYKYCECIDDYFNRFNIIISDLNNLKNFYDAGYDIEFNPIKKISHCYEDFENAINDFIEQLFVSINNLNIEGHDITSVFNLLKEILNKFLSLKLDNKYILYFKRELNKFADEYDLDIIDCDYKSETKYKNVDDMDGLEFEKFCMNVLKDNGFINLLLTKASGDQGVDIIGYKDEIKYAIQCKCYSQDIGNSAIQEVVSGKVYYDCDVAVVITNQYFTQGAIELAKANRVKLWDRNKLLEMLNNMSK